MPQPGVFAPAPGDRSASVGDGVSARPGQAGRKPAAPESREPSAEPSPTGLPSASPPVTPPTSKPPTSRPPTGPPSTAPPSTPPSDNPDAVYRSAQSQGGSATFEYDKSGDVYLVSYDRKEGWYRNAYRYDHDWVAVEFQTDGHVSTIHAYLDRGRAVIEVVEESY